MLIFFGNEDTSCCAHDAHIFSYAGSYAESTREISLAQSFPRKLKGPPNDPPLFSCFLPSSLSPSPLFQLFPFLSRPTANWDPRCKSWGRRSARRGRPERRKWRSWTKGGRTTATWSKDPATFARTGPISGNWTIYIQFFFMGRRRSCLALCCMVPSSKVNEFKWHVSECQLKQKHYF